MRVVEVVVCIAPVVLTILLELPHVEVATQAWVLETIVDKRVLLIPAVEAVEHRRIPVLL
jgi:hypothetical protein